MSIDKLNDKFSKLTTNDADSPQYGSAAKDAKTVDAVDKHQKISSNKVKEQSASDTESSENDTGPDGSSLRTGNKVGTKKTKTKHLADQWIKNSQFSISKKANKYLDDESDSDEEDGTLRPVRKAAGFLPFITKVLNLLRNQGLEDLIPSESGRCGREPNSHEIEAIGQLMETYVDFEAYPDWVTPPSGGIGGYQAFREAAMTVSSQVSRESMATKWRRLKLDKQTNPFMFVAEVKVLIKDSIEVGYLSSEDAALVYIAKSIQPGFPISPDECMFHSVRQMLKRIERYGIFCSEKLKGDVPWGKAGRLAKSTTQGTCLTCNRPGHSTANCRSYQYKSNRFQDKRTNKNPKQHHLRQVVHRESDDEEY